jgi:hypothetical protein
VCENNNEWNPGSVARGGVELKTLERRGEESRLEEERRKKLGHRAGGD